MAMTNDRLPVAIAYDHEIDVRARMHSVMRRVVVKLPMLIDFPSSEATQLRDIVFQRKREENKKKCEIQYLFSAPDERSLFARYYVL